MHHRSRLMLLVFVAVCELAGVLGSLFTASSIPTWYGTLTKPALNPPSWVFGPVWVTLYALMGTAAYLIWCRSWHEEAVRTALTVFGIQLLLNAIWSPLFFGLQQPGWAFVVIILLWFAILWTMRLFYRLSKTATHFLVPYLAWVTFAAYLNFMIYLLN